MVGTSAILRETNNNQLATAPTTDEWKGRSQLAFASMSEHCVDLAIGHPSRPTTICCPVEVDRGYLIESVGSSKTLPPYHVKRLFCDAGETAAEAQYSAIVQRDTRPFGEKKANKVCLYAGE